MDRITASLRERHTEQIEEQKERADDPEMGTSEAVRRIFDQAAESDELREKVDELRNRCDELESQLRAANTRIDASNELVEYVEEERSVERRYRSAGAFTRLRWWLTGMDESDDERG